MHAVFMFNRFVALAEAHVKQISKILCIRKTRYANHAATTTNPSREYVQTRLGALVRECCPW